MSFRFAPVTEQTTRPNGVRLLLASEGVRKEGALQDLFGLTDLLTCIRTPTFAPYLVHPEEG
jgi:hypothetical protein